MENTVSKKDFHPIWMYLVIFFGVQLLAGMILGVIYRGEVSQISDKLLTIITIVTYAVLFLVFVLIYFKRIKDDCKRLTKKNIIFILISAVVLIVLNYLISSLFESLDVEMNNQDTITGLMDNYKVLMIIAVTLFAPLAEEFVYRYSLSSIIKNDILFIIISSIIFGLMHGIGIVTTVYVLMGAILAIVYLKTDKNIASSTIVHILNNAFAVLTMFILLK